MATRMAPTKGFRSILVLLATACAVSACDYVRPFEQVCEKRLGPVSIQVEAPPTRQQFDFTQSAGALTARGMHAAAGRRVEGLTEANLTSRIALGGNGLVKPLSGRYCVRPEVSVTLAYQPLKVYVASEQASGTCAFDLTMNHEMKHVRLYERFLDELAGEITTTLKAALGEGIHYFPDAAAGERALNELVGATVNAAIRDAMAAAQKRQAGIDTQEEYDRLDLMASKCSQ